jgi:hypothetical protein
VFVASEPNDLAGKRRGFGQVWVWGAADRRQPRPIAYV